MIPPVSSTSRLPSQGAASPASASALRSPLQTLTKAFINNGELATALARTDAVPSKDPHAVLEGLHREMGNAAPSFSGVAELSQQLAEASMTEMGGRALIGDGQQKALNTLLEQCQSHLAALPANHGARGALTHAHGALKKARFHQSISQLTDDSHSRVCAVADLLGLTQLDPGVLAEKPEGMTPYMLFGTFIRFAKHRSVGLSHDLRAHPQDMEKLLKPHADTLEQLHAVPAAVAALEENCPDASIKADLHSLHEVATDLLSQLQASGIIQPPEREPDVVSLPGSGPAEPKASLSQSLLKTISNQVHKFDAYGAVAPMDDKTLLSLMRRPAPQLTSAQMHAFLNKRVIHLNDEQLAVISNTPLPAAHGDDVEAQQASSFDEKMRLALANGSLVLTEEQLSELRDLPKLDSSEALEPLLEKPDAELSDADRQMFKTITEANAPGQIDAWHAHNALLPGILDKSGLPADVRKEMLSINQQMNTELETLKNGASLLGRLAASPAMLLALAPLPLAVSFVSGDKSYSSSLVAHFSKNAVFMAGLMLNELTNKRTNTDHMLNRYFVTVMANVIVAQPTFAKNAHLLDNVGFGMATALISSGVTLGVFNRDSIWEAVASAKAKLFKSGTGEPVIAEADRQQVAAHFDQGEHIAQQVKLAVESFKKDSAITDILNSSLSFLGTKSSQLKTAFTVAEAGRTGQVVPKAERKADPDFYPKMGLVALTGGISAALVMLMQSLVGKADYAADGVWCTSEMLKLALNPEADMQKAVQTFKEIVGLNLVMVGFLGVNKAWDFLNKGAKGYAAGAAVLTGANLTMPGIIGEAAGSAAGKGLSFMADKGRAAHQAGKAAAGRAGDYARSTRLGQYANALQNARTPAAVLSTQNGGAVAVNAYRQWQNLSRRQPPAANVPDDDIEMQAPRNSSGAMPA